MARNRTSAGLRDTLFDALEKVKTGDMTADDALAIARLSRSICETVQLEIEVARLRSIYPEGSPLVIPAPLKLGERDVEKIEK